MSGWSLRDVTAESTKSALCDNLLLLITLGYVGSYCSTKTKSSLRALIYFFQIYYSTTDRCKILNGATDKYLCRPNLIIKLFEFVWYAQAMMYLSKTLFFSMLVLKGLVAIHL